MAKEFEITVIISTYNRSEMLAGAIESVLEQESEGVSVRSDSRRQQLFGQDERGGRGLHRARAGEPAIRVRGRSKGCRMRGTQG